MLYLALVVPRLFHEHAFLRIRYSYVGCFLWVEIFELCATLGGIPTKTVQTVLPHCLIKQINDNVHADINGIAHYTSIINPSAYYDAIAVNTSRYIYFISSFIPSFVLPTVRS